MEQKNPTKADDKTVLCVSCACVVFLSFFAFSFVCPRAGPGHALAVLFLFSFLFLFFLLFWPFLFDNCLNRKAQQKNGRALLKKVRLVVVHAWVLVL